MEKDFGGVDENVEKLSSLTVIHYKYIELKAKLQNFFS